jgi:uncharacterized protein YkwD
MPKVLTRSKIKPHVAKWRRDPEAIEKYQFIHQFVPHRYNRTRAQLLSEKALILYSLFFLLILLSFKFFTKTYPGVLGYASDIKIQEVFDLSNKKRADVGLPPLRLNPKLMEAAKEKGEDMFDKGYWAHVSPEGTEPWDFILAVDYDYAYAGENLAKNFSNSRDVVEAWYNSPSHKANILNKNYDEVGYAVIDGVLNGYETTLVVQMFGRPRDPSYLATAEDQEHILESVSAERNVASAVNADTSVRQAASSEIPVMSLQPRFQAVDAAIAVKGLAAAFTVFLIVLLGVDVWYSRRNNIVKLSGHTVAHLLFLITSLIGMLFALMPGKIL